MPSVIVGAVVLILVISGVAIFMALQKPAAVAPSRHAMAETALKGIEAVIVGDTDTLASLSDATMTAQLTPDVTYQLQLSGLAAKFSVPNWDGDSFDVTVVTDTGEGVLIGGPVPDGNDVVLFRTMGSIGATTGGVTLTPSGTGWTITAFAAGKSAPSTASVLPTAAPSATPTP
jgi:hypothetical protein